MIDKQMIQTVKVAFSIKIGLDKTCREKLDI